MSNRLPNQRAYGNILSSSPSQSARESSCREKTMKTAHKAFAQIPEVDRIPTVLAPKIRFLK